MRTKVEVAPQVREFARSLAPAPRRALTQAIKSLAHDVGDRRILEDKLSGYHRLRVAGHRVIYREQPVGGARVIFCIFAGRRSVVYELFQQMLPKELAKP